MDFYETLNAECENNNMVTMENIYSFPFCDLINQLS
jgi:hypothetical protein